MIQSSNRLCLIATLCVLLPACVSTRPIKYYRIDVPAPAAATPGASFGVALQVDDLDSPPIMRDGRILYAVGAHEVGAYEYHRWVEAPDRMIQDSLVRLLRASGRYSSVDDKDSRAAADYIVRGKIYQFSEVDAPEIRTRVSMEIELRDAKSGRTLWSQTYTHEEPVNGRQIPDVVDSLERNLREGLSEIVTGLGQYFSAHPAVSHE